jgi:hypothetical protein
MAVLAIAFALDEPKLSHEPHRQVGKKRLFGKLRILNPQRPAVRAPNRTLQPSALGIPLQQELPSSIGLLCGDFESNSGSASWHEPKFRQPRFIMDLRTNAGLNQALPGWFGLGVILKKYHSHPAHKARFLTPSHLRGFNRVLVPQKTWILLCGVECALS